MESTVNETTETTVTEETTTETTETEEVLENEPDFPDPVLYANDGNIYEITLGSGEILTDVTKNGGIYVTKIPIETDLTNARKVLPIIISDGTTATLYSDMTLMEMMPPVEDLNWYVMRKLSEKEMWSMKIESDIEYLAMMTDVEM